MKKSKNKISVIVVIGLIYIFGLSSFAFALNEGSTSDASIEEEFNNMYTERFTDRMEEGRIRLNNIKSTLDDEYTKFSESMKTSRETEQKLAGIQSQLGLLNNQLKNISLQLEETNQKITAINLQIEKKKSDLELLYAEKEKISAEAEAQKQVVVKYFKLLQEENATVRDDEVKNTLKLLLADASFSSHLRNEMYLSSWEETEREVFNNLETAMSQLEETEEVLNDEKEKLENLNEMLEKEKYTLETQKEAKENLIQETKGVQSEYQKLWQESRQQMEESVLAIQDLRVDQDLIREKLQILEQQKKDSFNNANDENDLSREVVEGSEDEARYEIGEIFQEADLDTPLAWPVDPSRGITAYYQDESYKDVFGIAHNAIDLRASQGTEIHAPALGFVYKVVDNGMGYSYIILAHKNNLTTLYGHVSEFMVEEGDMVQAGDVIGLSGGMPGTKGAGVMTTGPHLHFEVFEDGEHVNPLDYLALDELPIEYVPAEYLDNKNF